MNSSVEYIVHRLIQRWGYDI